MSHAAVITGVGVLTACGRGEDVLARAIVAGEPACREDDELRALGSRCALFARVADVEPSFASLPIDDAERRYFGRFSQIGAVAAHDAYEDAGRPEIARVIVATATGPMGELEACFRATLLGAPHAHVAHAVTRVTPSFLATYLAASFGARGGGHVVSSACTSAMTALADAVARVERGEDEAVLVGGVEEDCASTFWAFDRQRQLSYAPSIEERTRPLSGKIGGFVPGGGAAFVVVEREEAARARGAKVRGRIGKVVLRTEREPSVSPIGFPGAAYRAALRDALGGRPVDLVLAHAPPTVADPDELASIASLVESRVRSYKSIFGYTVGASVAIDLVIALAHLGRRSAWKNDFDTVTGAAEPYSRALLDDGGPITRVAKVAYAQGFCAGALVVEAA